MQNRLVVLGAGESGTGAALLGKAKGWNVFVSDFGTIAPIFKTKLEAAAIPFEEGGHSEAKILEAELVIKSPGIPYKAPIIKALLAKGIPIIDELEFAYRYAKGKFICITGSNGKTTTTLLTYHLLKSAGLSVAIGGNVGFSLASQVIDGVADWYVLEVSSFQLDGWETFKPQVAAITNITPDHLDRYDYKFENYAAAKFRIAMNQTEEDCFIGLADGGLVEEAMTSGKIKAQKAMINQNPITGFGACVSEEDSLVFNYLDAEGNQKHFDLSLQNSPLKGQHNKQNIMVAVLAALRARVPENTIEKSLATFVNAPHRLEQVGVIDGVTYINDSKATNVDSVKYALGAFNQPIVWIAGGVDKGNDYNEIADLVLAKVVVLIILGENKANLLTAFGGKLPEIMEAKNMEEAVNFARTLGKPGDVVLLSPACASFDLFNNYEHRGTVFRELVQNLA